MRGRHVLITGGAGLIGSHIADMCVRDSAARVVVFDNFVRGRRENLTQALKSDTVTVVEGDIRDRGKLAAAMQGIDLVFHQAAIRINQCAEEPRLALEVLVDGTYNVVEEAQNSGVKKIVAASSASVYGLADHFPTTEDQHPYNNRTIYGASKAFNEGLLRSFNEMYGLDYVILRYFNVYGPRMDIHGAYTEVLVRWIERIEKGLPPIILGDGTQTMDFIYAEDIARANILAARADVCDEVINVGSGKETSLRELAEALKKIIGSDVDLEYGPERKVNPVPRRLADTAKAMNLLNFKAEISLEEGLKRLVTFWKTEKSF